MAWTPLKWPHLRAIAQLQSSASIRGHIILEVEAILGKARDHAKWQGVIAPRYKMDLKIEFDINKKNEVKEFIEKLPKDLVKIKNNKIELCYFL